MSLSETIQSHIKSDRRNFFTSIPAVVTKVHEVEGSTVVDCEIGVRYLRKDYTIEEDAPLTNVPLIWPSAGGCYITLPIEQGDTVMVNFAMRDCDEWKSSGGVTDPITSRLHNPSDCFATPAALPYGKAPKVDSEAVKVSSGATEVRIMKDGTIELGKGAVERLLKGDSFLSAFLNHTHTQVSFPGGTSTAVPALTSGVTTALSTPDTIDLWEDNLSEVSKTK